MYVRTYILFNFHTSLPCFVRPRQLLSNKKLKIDFRSGAYTVSKYLDTLTNCGRQHYFIISLFMQQFTHITQFFLHFLLQRYGNTVEVLFRP